MNDHGSSIKKIGKLSSGLLVVGGGVGGKPWNSSGEELEPLFVGKLGRGREKRDLEEIK